MQMEFQLCQANGSRDDLQKQETGCTGTVRTRGGGEGKTLANVQAGGSLHSETLEIPALLDSPGHSSVGLRDNQSLDPVQASWGSLLGLRSNLLMRMWWRRFRGLLG